MFKDTNQRFHLSSWKANANLQILIIFFTGCDGYRSIIINRNYFELFGLAPPKISVIKLDLLCSRNPNDCCWNPIGR
ncbi:hypothetical protein HanRHA438_Chr17g0818361 [Helianthus annuus]|nr:hypothetical protein HanRHA438_Chr17g0818361 [Helianthus annuus]